MYLATTTSVSVTGAVIRVSSVPLLFSSARSRIVIIVEIIKLVNPNRPRISLMTVASAIYLNVV